MCLNSTCWLSKVDQDASSKPSCFQKSIIYSLSNLDSSSKKRPLTAIVYCSDTFISGPVLCGENVFLVHLSYGGRWTEIVTTLLWEPPYWGCSSGKSCFSCMQLNRSLLQNRTAFLWNSHFFSFYHFCSETKLHAQRAEEPAWIYKATLNSRAMDAETSLNKPSQSPIERISYTLLNLSKSIKWNGNMIRAKMHLKAWEHLSSEAWSLPSHVIYYI